MSSSDEPARAPKRHPEYYLDALPVVFEVEKTLFKVDAALLRTVSPTLDALLGLPAVPDDSSPLSWGGFFEKQQFEHFVQWFFRLRFIDPEVIEKEFLMDILHVCHFLMIDSGVQYASHWLWRRADIAAPFKMRLARRYDLNAWVRPLTSQLMEIPLDTITGAEIDHIYIPVFAIITRGREMYRESLNALAAHPPVMFPKDSGPYCAQHDQCCQAWVLVWQTRVSSKLILRTDGLCPSNLIDYLETLTYSGMNPACLQAELGFLRGRPAMFNIWDRIVSGVAEAVHKELGIPVA